MKRNNKKERVQFPNPEIILKSILTTYLKKDETIDGLRRKGVTN